jgi:hypothetical protein
MGLWHESDGGSHCTLHLPNSHGYLQEPPSNSCHGLLWMGKEMLCSDLLLSIASRGRNLVLVSRKDGIRMVNYSASETSAKFMTPPIL